MTTTLTNDDKVVQEYDPSPGTLQIVKPTPDTKYKVGKMTMRTPCIFVLKSSVFNPSTQKSEYAPQYGIFGLLPARRSDVEAFKMALRVGWEEYITRPEMEPALNDGKLPPLLDKYIIPYSKDKDDQTEVRNKDNPEVLAFSANTAGYKGSVQLPGPPVSDSTGRIVKLTNELPMGSEVIVAATAAFKVKRNEFDEVNYGKVSFYLNRLLVFKMGEQLEQQTASLPVGLTGGWTGDPEEEEEAPAEEVIDEMPF